METTLKDGRNYGIDALRLFSMFLVAVLHVLGHGGVLEAAGGPQSAIAWLMETAAYCAVNCFALISGYVGYSKAEKPWRPANYLRLWLGVFVYSFGITLLARVLRPEQVAWNDVLKSMLPVTTKQYWYFTAYTGLFFVLPGLNALLRGASDRELNRTVAGLFGVLSVYGTLVASKADIFQLKNGYSFLWIAAVYVMGGWMRRNSESILRRVTTAGALAGIAACVAVTWGWRLLLPSAPQILLSYTSPTILLAAAGWTLVFSRLSFAGAARAFVRSLSPAAFGVYLIHVHPVCWRLIEGRFAWIAASPAWLLPLPVLGCALGVFAACLLIEKTRLILFGKAASAMQAVRAKRRSAHS